MLLYYHRKSKSRLLEITKVKMCFIITRDRTSWCFNIIIIRPPKWFSTWTRSKVRTKPRRKNKRQFSRLRVNESVIMSFEHLIGSLTARWRKSVKRIIRRCIVREKEREEIVRERRRRRKNREADSFYDVDRVRVKSYLRTSCMNYL